MLRLRDCEGRRQRAVRGCQGRRAWPLSRRRHARGAGHRRPGDPDRRGCRPLGAGSHDPACDLAGAGPVRRLGEQLDIRCIGTKPDDLTSPPAEAVAAYIAKYATKATEGFGAALDRRLTARDLDHLDVNEHIAELVQTCWRLGAEPSLAPLRLRQWAHMLGFRGHWSTKSRRYSTTFTALRRARVEHATRERLDPWGRPARKRRRSWWGSGATRAGGYRTAADAWLAPRLPPAPANSDGSPRGAGRLMR